MSNLSNYMAEKRLLLAESYPANCLTIARDIAALLLDSGNQPFIVSLSKTEEIPAGRYHHPLMPKKYGGRVTWTKHYVCCCEGMVYDPMLDAPVPLAQYSRIIFDQDFPIEKFVSEEAIPIYLSQPLSSHPFTV